MGLLLDGKMSGKNPFHGCPVRLRLLQFFVDPGDLMTVKSPLGIEKVQPLRSHPRVIHDPRTILGNPKAVSPADTVFLAKRCGRKQELSSLGRGPQIEVDVAIPPCKDLDPELIRIGRHAAARLCEKTGINLAGFDLIFPSGADRPDPLLLEINYFFGRRGLGGPATFYDMLNSEINHWLARNGLSFNH